MNTSKIQKIFAKDLKKGDKLANNLTIKKINKDLYNISKIIIFEDGTMTHLLNNEKIIIWN